MNRQLALPYAVLHCCVSLGTKQYRVDCAQRPSVMFPYSTTTPHTHTHLCLRHVSVTSLDKVGHLPAYEGVAAAVGVAPHTPDTKAGHSLARPLHSVHREQCGHVGVIQQEGRTAQRHNLRVQGWGGGTRQGCERGRCLAAQLCILARSFRQGTAAGAPLGSP